MLSGDIQQTVPWHSYSMADFLAAERYDGKVDIEVCVGVVVGFRFRVQG